MFGLAAGPGAPSVQLSDGLATGLTTVGGAGLFGGTAIGSVCISVVQLTLSRAQLSNAWYLDVEQALRKSACLVGAVSIQPGGPRPEATQTPSWQSGCPSNREQSALTEHCSVFLLMITLHPVLATITASPNHEVREI